MKKKARKLEKQISTVNVQLEKLEKNVKSQKDKLDVDRDVCQAHVIFNEESYKKFVLHRYRFSGSFLWRLCQSRALRFEGRALTVKQAYEPSNIYCENLDFDPKKICDVQMFADDACQDNLFGSIGVEKIVALYDCLPL
ncbi:hypothetical protein Pmar_PMAR015594 [Perkinsus marinus ATCC 50983]|uniref:Uncharacterized protein n=1 Tax=Perkinsus marinus (strain ATCC 50983 / TXsc) TaxID=423536 RepID=C5KUJ9_PERM5|nr:hypothetical protein Pmar_PMAR015594 [Perkinsus marinus ATCC 50983]EER11886.1 hypothetical protein Pmar_PMAR015594 [Perkinsus marinus ATCC 50983]|eukprot:XP_002780091.1 hypothetical protein Pmar_PMAR015594 [Perkinsus marinus ATCC 50983]